MVNGLDNRIRKLFSNMTPIWL